MKKVGEKSALSADSEATSKVTQLSQLLVPIHGDFSLSISESRTSHEELAKETLRKQPKKQYISKMYFFSNVQYKY